MNADLRCLSIVVLLLALTGCDSDSKPSAGNDTTATLDPDATKAQVDATTHEKRVASATPKETTDEPPHQTEKNAVAAIEELGGWVTISEGHVFAVYLDNAEVNDAGLVHLQGLTTLENLDLSNTRVSDAGLVHLKGLTKLYWLYLSNTKVTDAGLVNLKGMVNLQTLNLNNTKVTDAGLEHLQGLTNLQMLEL